jgi:hypothetical protein
MMLAYYIGAYGPTIRLDTQMLEDLRAVRRLFGGLVSGEVVQEDLCKTLACRDSLQSLMVQSSPEPNVKALELKGHGWHGPIFSWTNTYTDWLECAEKVDALILSDSPGHQYLTSEGLDDALVELCYKE